jgi:hypothetical protein
VDEIPLYVLAESLSSVSSGAEGGWYGWKQATSKQMYERA